MMRSDGEMEEGETKISLTAELAFSHESRALRVDAFPMPAQKGSRFRCNLGSRDPREGDAAAFESRSLRADTKCQFRWVTDHTYLTHSTRPRSSVGPFESRHIHRTNFSSTGRVFIFIPHISVR